MIARLAALFCFVFVALAGPVPSFADPPPYDCSNTAETGIPESECQALVDMYNTYGAEHFDGNWLTGTTPCNWNGLACENGHVVWIAAPSGATGPVPDLSALTELVWLDLNGNHFTGEFPAWIFELDSLQAIHFNFSDLSGELPDFTDNPALWEIWLTGNEFTGDFPAVSNSVLVLELSGNNLSGKIPDLSQTNLVWVNVADNDFGGTLPTLPPWIQYADFSRNRFKGVIPQSYGLLPFIEHLNLSGNRLSGEVPGAIGDLENIGEGADGLLDLSYNSLTATDPELVFLLTGENPLFFSSQTLTPTDFAVKTGYFSARFSWKPIKFKDGPGHYEIGLSTTSGSGYVFTDTADKLTDELVMDGLAPGKYYAVIRAVSEADEHNPNTLTSAKSAEIAFKVTGKPNQPSLLAPAHDAIVRGVNSPVFSWTPNAEEEGVTGYRLKIVSVATGETVLFQSFGTEICSDICSVDLADVPLDLAPGAYTWRVDATNTNGTRAGSLRPFTLAVPAKPVVTAPSGAVALEYPVLIWTVDAVDANTGYRVIVLNKQGTKVVDVVVNHGDACVGINCGTSLGVLPGGPFALPNGRYTLKIKAINEIGTGKPGKSTFKLAVP